MQYNKVFQDSITEKMLLSTAIIKRDALLDLVELDPEVFYNEKHKLIYSAMKQLHNEGEEIDVMALRCKLAEAGQLQYIGGDNYLAELLENNSLVNYKFAGRTLTKLLLRRKLAGLSLKIHDLTNQSGVENELILNEIEETIRQVDRINHDDYTDIKDLMAGELKDYDVTGKYIPTGFTGLDSRLIGLFKGELIILAARPGVGKTALAMNITTNIAKTHNTLFISLEMSTRQIGMRALSAEAMVDSDLLRRGNFQEHTAKLEKARSELKKLKLGFIQSYTIDEIVSKIRKMSQHKNVEFVVIDYLQLVQVTSNNQRYVQVGEISRKLKLLSIELDIPIMALAQINRAAEERLPKLSDLRESGDIEQDADVVLFIHKKTEGENVDILFAKNRSGKADSTAEMIFKKQFTRFFDVDKYL